MKSILNYAKKEATPPKKLQEKKLRIAKKVHDLVKQETEKYPQVVGFELGGSYAKDTWLAEKADIDIFVIRANEGGASLSGADVVTDFSDGTDIIGMSGLQYSQLTVEQGSGDYASHVIVKKTDTGEFLVIIQNVSLSDISNADFSAV